MSTTFEVLPGKPNIPDFSEILALSNKNINAYLSNIGIHNKLSIAVNLQKIITHELIDFETRDKFLQNESNYAWFYFPDVAGGIACYYYRNLPIYVDIWREELTTNINEKKYKDIIMKNMNLGYRWIFRRSAGQPAIAVLLYGILAASLAHLTDGIIFSDDGAWDYSKFPALADEFMSWYFRPEFATKEEDRSFSEQCISEIINKYS